MSVICVGISSSYYWFRGLLYVARGIYNQNTRFIPMASVCFTTKFLIDCVCSRFVHTSPTLIALMALDNNSLIKIIMSKPYAAYAVFPMAVMTNHVVGNLIESVLYWSSLNVKILLFFNDLS